MTRFHSLSRKLLLTSLPLIPAALILMIALESRPVYAAPAPQAALRMSCSSDDMHRHVCLVDTTGGVQMVHQKSQAKCIQNSTWGYDNRGIWVDRGCRADFEVLVGGYSNGNSANYGPDWNTGNVTALYCPSDDGKRHYCAAETRWAVRLVKQRSGSPCTQGSTWGYDNQGIWVDRGCRADFEVLTPRR